MGTGIGDMTFFGAVIFLWDICICIVYVCSHAHGNKHQTFHATCCSAGFQLYMWGHTNLCGCHICLSFPRLFGIMSFSGSPKGTTHDWCRRTMKKNYFAMKTNGIRW